MIRRFGTTPAYTSIVSLVDLGDQLRVDSSVESGHLTALLNVSVEECENRTMHAIAPRKWSYQCDELEDILIINLGNVIQVDSLKYLDENHQEQTMDTENYRVVSDQYQTRIEILESFTTSERIGSVTAVMTCGYTSPADTPAPIIHAIKMIVSSLYEMRQDEITGTVISKVAMNADSLLMSYKNPAI